MDASDMYNLLKLFYYFESKDKYHQYLIRHIFRIGDALDWTSNINPTNVN